MRQRQRVAEHVLVGSIVVVVVVLEGDVFVCQERPQEHQLQGRFCVLIVTEVRIITGVVM